jgi:hypothetical protein
MEQNKECGSAVPDPPAADSAEQPSSKRQKTPTAKALDMESGEKAPQMVISDALLVFVAKCIQADPDAWGVLLTNKNGKSGVAAKFVKFLQNHENPLTHGKKPASTATVANWIKNGMQKAADETSRRATALAAGRGIADGSVPEVDRVWYELMEVWGEYLKEKPATDRYNTPPEHLRGLVQLKRDDSPLLPCGREEKAAGDTMREAAITVVAEKREKARKENPDSKAHLVPRRLKEEAASGGTGSDAFLQAYVSMESSRNQQELRAAKVAELNSYSTMLSNPHFPPDQKAAIHALMAGVSKELQEMQVAAATAAATASATAAATAAGDGGVCLTPVRSAGTTQRNVLSPAGSTSSSEYHSSQ